MASDDLDLDAIEARARAATPGPWWWESVYHGILGGEPAFIEAADARVLESFNGPAGKYHEAAFVDISNEDQRHIAGMCPATTLRLVTKMRADKARIRELETRVAELEAGAAHGE